MRSLLVLTTANQREYTERAVASLDHCAARSVDVLVVDDASDDGTPEFLRSKGIAVLTKREPRGLTDSWNRAYREFARSTHETLILANNDIIVPRGAVDHLVEQLGTHVMVGAMSTALGVGHQPAQSVRALHPGLPLDEMDPQNVQRVQDYVAAAALESEVAKLPYVNGFFFGLSRAICAHEFADGTLFDPQRTNIGNEDDLCSRLGAHAIGVCARSFVFHFKGATLSAARFDGAGAWGGRNMLWTTARTLRDGLAHG